MATYFFHLRDGGDLLLDAEGRTLDGEAAIAAAALSEARAILSADMLTGRVNLDQRIEVEDDAGALIHRLRFVDAFEVAGGRAACRRAAADGELPGAR